MLIRTVGRSVCRGQLVPVSQVGVSGQWSPVSQVGGVRTIFWWGHDTEEDKAERAALEKSKGLISWTDPKKDLDKKKEYVWAPARIEEEAYFTTGMTQGMMNHVDLLKWTDKNITNGAWHTWMTDPLVWKEDMKKRHYKHLVLSQVFLRERLQALGPDLAAAHFLCHRNCRVRFRGQENWTQLEPDGSLNIPAAYVPGWYIEAIEASTADLVYEGLQNFRNLDHLKWLDLSYCQYMDEWCMDRITGEFSDNLEYLNISGCKNINWNGLEVVWRLRNLKTLVIKDMDHIKDLTLICLLLLDAIPGLKIEGADYLDMSLLEGSQYEHLMLDDIGSCPKIEAGEFIQEQSSVNS